jgi:leucyl-tRNA synthetase
MGPRAPGDVGGVDLYVGGVEHAVLHLLYARFWHKILFDLGHVSSEEPYRRLFNQGMVQAFYFEDDRGVRVPAAEIVERDGKYYYQDKEVTRHYGKMGKSLKNVVTPDEMCAQYGADTFRVYEMSMGPLDVSRPWDTRAVVGSQRFLQRVWRAAVDENTGELRVTDEPVDPETNRLLHRTIDGVRADMAGMRFNTAVAKLIELTNRVTAISTGGTGAPKAVIEPLVQMMAPVAPHIAEELWQRLGHDGSLTFEPFPVADPALLVDDAVTYPVQVNGKVRGRIEVAADASQDVVRAAALSEVDEVLAGRTPKKVIVVPGRMVSVVV